MYVFENLFTKTMEKTNKCKPPCKTLVLAETTLKILYLPMATIS